MSDPLDIVERVIQILEDGSFSSTYKLAVLAAMLDLCVEKTDAGGHPPSSLTTRELAEKVMALYWRQVERWPTSNGLVRGLGTQKPSAVDIEGRLKQNNGKKSARILAIVAQLRSDAEAMLGGQLPTPLRVARVAPALYLKALDKVEWCLIEMPLPKLQRVGGQDTGWLYQISWSDRGPVQVCRGVVSAYQRDPSRAGFDNQIRLQPGVGETFARLHGLLRPLIQQRWASEVARMNGLREAALHDYLFGYDRGSLEPVRQPLRALQRARCFYCQRALGDQPVEVDHFLPWSRHPDNGLDNLVLAHDGCNNSKRDWLAAPDHLSRWRRRLEDDGPALEQIASELRWERGGPPLVGGEPRALGSARALYLRLPPDARLWANDRHFVLADPPQLRALLG